VLALDGYVRVSKVGGREGDGFISPEVQETAIREWAKRSAVDVVMQPHELKVSGGTMDRPVFNRIMERASAPVSRAGSWSISSTVSPAACSVP
jgi:site-specific DNA recombinase